MIHRLVAIGIAAVLAFSASTTLAQTPTCTPGQVVSDKTADPELFQIQVLAVPGTPSVQKALLSEGFEKGWKLILAGLSTGATKRTDRDGNSGIIIEGVDAKKFPKRLSYLMGDDICQAGTLEVIPHGSGVVVYLPVMKVAKGQSALLIPRQLAASASRICAEAPYRIYSESRNGQLVVGKLNCANTAASASARRGSSAFLFALAEAQ